MSTIIAGSRNINNKKLVFNHINEASFTIEEVVTGKAEGVDSIGENGQKIIIFQ